MGDYFIDEPKKAEDNYFVDETPQQSFFDRVAVSDKPNYFPSLSEGNFGRIGDAFANIGSAVDDTFLGAGYKTIDAASGLVRSAEDTLGTGTTFGEGTHENAKRYIDELRSGFQPDSLGQQAFDISSSTIPALGAMAFTGPAVIPLLAGQAYGDRFNELRDKGTDVGRSNLGAAGDAITSTIFNKYARVPLLKSDAGFLKKTLGLIGLNEAALLPQTVFSDFMNNRLTGETFTADQFKDQLKEGAITGAVTAPFFALAGGIAEGGKVRGVKPSDSVDAASKRWENLPDIPAPTPEMLGLPEPQKKLPGVDYAVGDNFTARDTPGRIEPPLPDKVTLPIAQDLSSLPRANMEPVVPSNTGEMPAPKGIQVETSSARTPEEMQAMQDILQSAVESQKPALFGPDNQPLTKAAGLTPPSGEVIKPFTNTGEVRKSLSPMEQAVARDLSKARPLSSEPVLAVKDPIQSGKSFPDVRKEVQKVDEAKAKNQEIQNNTPRRLNHNDLKAYPGIDRALQEAQVAEQALAEGGRTALHGTSEGNYKPLDIFQVSGRKKEGTIAIKGGSERIVKDNTLKIRPPVYDFHNQTVVLEDANGGFRKIALGNQRGMGGLIAQDQISKTGASPLTHGFEIDMTGVKRAYDITHYGKEGSVDIYTNPNAIPLNPIPEAAPAVAQIEDQRPQQRQAMAEQLAKQVAEEPVPTTKGKKTYTASRIGAAPLAEPGSKQWVKEFQKAQEAPNFNFTPPKTELDRNRSNVDKNGKVTRSYINDREWENLNRARSIIDANAEAKIAATQKGKKKDSQRGSFSWKQAKPADAFTSDAVKEVGDGFKERDFSKGEKIAGGIVGNDASGRDVSRIKKAFNRYFGSPQTLADHDPGYKIAVDAALAENRHIHKVAEGVGEFFKPYYEANDAIKKEAVNALYGLEQATRGGKARQATPESLAAIGLSPEAIDVAMGIRKGLDKALDTAEHASILRATEEMKLQAKGIEDPQAQIDFISKLPAKINEVKKIYADMRQSNYMPHTRFGNYFTAATLPNGEKYFAMHESKGKMNADAARLNTLGATEKTKGLFGRADSDIPNIPPDMALKFGKVDPEMKIVGDGFQKHFQGKKFIAGYDQNFDRVAADYITSLARWSSKQISSPEYQKAFANLESRGMNKANSELYRSLERYVSEQKNPSPEYSGIKKWLVPYYLGGQLKSPLFNLTQTFTTTLPEMYKHIGVGKSWKVMGESYKLAREFGSSPEKFSKANPELALAIKEAITDGAISEQSYRDLTGRTRESKLQKYLGNESLGDKAMYIFDKAEKFNRLSSFIAGREVATRKGLKGQAAQDFAERFVSDTQFDYSKALRPEIARGGVKSLAATFRLFQYNYFRLMKNNMSPGNFKSGVGQLGHMLALTGGMGFPLAKLFVSALNNYGYDPEHAAKELLGDSFLARTARGGLPYAAGLVDAKGSLGLGDAGGNIDQGLAPGALKLLLGVAGDPFERISKAGFFLNKGYKARALEQILPEALRYPARALRIGTGWGNEKNAGLRDANNIPLMNGKTPMTKENVSMGDLVKYGLGFQPPTFTDINAQKHAIDIIDKVSRDNDGINEKLAQLKYEGDLDGYRALRASVNERNKTLPRYAQINISDEQIQKYIRDKNKGKSIKKYVKDARLTIKGIMSED